MQRRHCHVQTQCVATSSLWIVIVLPAIAGSAAAVDAGHMLCTHQHPPPGKEGVQLPRSSLQRYHARGSTLPYATDHLRWVGMPRVILLFHFAALEELVYGTLCELMQPPRQCPLCVFGAASPSTCLVFWLECYLSAGRRITRGVVRAPLRSPGVPVRLPPLGSEVRTSSHVCRSHHRCRERQQVATGGHTAVSTLQCRPVGPHVSDLEFRFTLHVAMEAAHPDQKGFACRCGSPVVWPQYH